MFSSRIKGVDDTLKTSEERSDYADTAPEETDTFSGVNSIGAA